MHHIYISDRARQQLCVRQRVGELYLEHAAPKSVSVLLVWRHVQNMQCTCRRRRLAPTRRRNWNLILSRVELSARRRVRAGWPATQSLLDYAGAGRSSLCKARACAYRIRSRYRGPPMYNHKYKIIMQHLRWLNG